MDTLNRLISGLLILAVCLTVTASSDANPDRARGWKSSGRVTPKAPSFRFVTEGQASPLITFRGLPNASTWLRQGVLAALAEMASAWQSSSRCSTATRPSLGSPAWWVRERLSVAGFPARWSSASPRPHCPRPARSDRAWAEPLHGSAQSRESDLYPIVRADSPGR